MTISLELRDVAIGAAGFGLGIGAEYVRYRLDWRLSNRTRAQDHRERQIEDAYAPAYQLFGEMLQTYPEHEHLTVRARQLMETKAGLFNREDSELMWIATTEFSQLDDIVWARRALGKRLDLGSRSIEGG